MPVVSKKKEEKVEYDYNVKVLRAIKFDSGNISFDMIVNGVTIRNCTHIDYKDKESGDIKSFISFPSQKGKDGKYYPYIKMEISDTLLTDIEEQISNIL